MSVNKVLTLVLGLLGMSATTIVEAYVLTAQYLVGAYLDEVRQRAARNGIPWEWYQHQVDCHLEFMHITLQYLEERYDGITAYGRTIGLSDEQCDRLREALLA